MDFKDFINSEDFEIIKDVNLETFDTSNLFKLDNINLNKLEFTELEAIEALTEASCISDGSDVPSTPSYQPLNEAGLLTSGEAINKSAIGSIVNNTLGVQEDNTAFLNNISQFAENTSFNISEESINKIKENQEILSKGVLSISNGADLANGGVKIAGTTISLGASNVSIGSDTVVHITSPIINSVTTVENRQAASIQETTDFKSTVARNSFSQVEGLTSNISQNTIKTNVESDISISNYHSNTAIEKSVNTSNEIENIANTTLKNRSEGTIINEADDAISTQSSTINITAAEGSAFSDSIKLPQADNIDIFNNSDSLELLTTDGSGKNIRLTNLKETNIEKWRNTKGLEGINKEEVKPLNKSKGKGNLNILAKGSEGTVTILNENLISSSNKNYNNSVGGNLNNVAQGSVTSSGKFVNLEGDTGTTISSEGYIRTQSGRTGTVISNGFTFAGFRFGTLKKFIDKANNIPLKIRQIDALSEVPIKLTSQNLKNCLPDKYNLESLEEIDIEEDAPTDINAPTIKDVKKRYKSQPIPSGKNSSTISANDSGVLSKTNVAEFNNSTILNSDNSPSNQSEVINRNNNLASASIFKGGADIYLLDQSRAFDLFKRQNEELFDPDSEEENGGDSLLYSLITGLNSLSITNLSIKLNQPPEASLILKEQINNLKKYFLKKLINDSSLIQKNEVILPEEEEVINNLLKNRDISLFLTELEKELNARVATGGLLNFTSKINKQINSSVNIASDFIDQNNSNDIFQTLKNNSDITKLITNDNLFTDISNILNSSNTLSNTYNQVKSLINPNSNFMDKTLDLISNESSSILESININDIDKATNLAKVLNKAKSSSIYEEQGASEEFGLYLINEIATELNIDISQARSIFIESQTLITNILNGDISKLVEESELQNIVGYFIGSSNAAVLGNIKNIYFQTKNVIENGKDLYATGKASYQSAVDIYSSLKSVPAIIGMMNKYEIPVLNQIKTILSCNELIEQIDRILDNTKSSITNLVNSVEELFDAFGELVNNTDDMNYESISEGFAKGSILNNNNPIPLVNLDELNNPSIIIDSSNSINNEQSILNAETCSNIIFSDFANDFNSLNPAQWQDTTGKLVAIDFIEKLPRLSQIYNSIKDIPTELPVTIFEELTQEQIQDIKTTTPVVNLDSCYIAPELNIIESSINVIELVEGYLVYEMTNPQVLDLNNKNIFPTNDTIVQIYVEEFFNTKLNISMSVARTLEFFSPKIFNYKTVSYDRNKNIGIAHLINTQSRIHLKNTNNIIYNYSINEIGQKLSPIILDSYIVL